MDLSQERIVITGGDGFLGRHLQARLQQLGIEPDSLGIPHQRDYDLTHEENVIRLYRDMEPTVVIHLAAEVGGIGANQASPGRFFYANLAMGLHLIEQGRLHGLKKFVQVGTICAYPKMTPVPFREENLWNGYPEETNAPYGVAKKSLLVMLQAYRQQYGFNGIYLLPVNLYGPGDNFDLQTSHVIPALIRKFETARQQGLSEVEIWGTGKASREFLYVKDCAEAITLATQGYHDPEPMNIGAGFEITISELAEKIKTLTGYQGQLVWNHTKPDGQPRRSLDVSCARDALGFAAPTSFDQGLQETLDWWRQHATPSQ